MYISMFTILIKRVFYIINALRTNAKIEKIVMCRIYIYIYVMTHIGFSMIKYIDCYLLLFFKIYLYIYYLHKLIFLNIISYLNQPLTLSQDLNPNTGVQYNIKCVSWKHKITITSVGISFRIYSMPVYSTIIL